MLIRKLSVFIVVWMVFIGISHTQESDSEKLWKFSWSPYLYLSTLEGDMAVKGNKVSVDWGFDDIIDMLEFIVPSYTEIQYDRFILINDTAYYKLGESAELTFIRDGDLIGSVQGDTSIDVDSKQWAIKTLFGYRVIDQLTSEEDQVRFALDLFTGFYYNSLKSELDGDLDIIINLGPAAINRGVDLEVADSEYWWQHVYGIRTVVAFTDQILWSTIGDIGTGYENENFSWSVKSILDYKFSRNWSAYLGYQAIDMDFQDNGFEYNVTTHGPYLGVMVHF